MVCVLLEAFEGCSQITSPVSELATESQFFHQPTAKSQLTGFSPIGVQQKELEANSPKTISNTELNHDLIEHMHLCCKALLVISKYIGKQMKVFSFFCVYATF